MCKSTTYLCIANVYDLPEPMPPEFHYIVCEPLDGELYFYSGHWTFESADTAAAMIDGVVLQINLKGIVGNTSSLEGESNET